MHRIVREIQVATDPQTVWRLIGPFDAIHQWHPDVLEPTLTGDPTTPGTRRVFGAGTEGETVEELISIDAERMEIVYRLVDPPFPITGHTASLQVWSADDGSRVTWTASFEATDDIAEQMEQTLGDEVFTPGLKGIAAKLRR